MKKYKNISEIKSYYKFITNHELIGNYNLGIYHKYRNKWNLKMYIFFIIKHFTRQLK